MSQSTATVARYIALRTLGWCLVGFLALIVLGILGGPRFEPILNIIGLSVPDYRGIFIDCSKPANRNNDFCKPGSQRLARTPPKTAFRQIDKNAMPFTLNE